MKLKINKACDLTSISVLPPHARFEFSFTNSLICLVSENMRENVKHQNFEMFKLMNRFFIFCFYFDCFLWFFNALDEITRFFLFHYKGSVWFLRKCWNKIKIQSQILFILSVSLKNKRKRKNICNCLQICFYIWLL